MDLEKAASNEVFKPLVSIAVPGGIALAPYIIIAEHYIPDIATFWHDHDAAFTAIVIGMVLAVGLILEDMGALIEIGFDSLLEKFKKNQVENWKKYLKLKTRDEYIAQRYIRTLVPRLKFEMSMAPAIVCLWLGLYWIQSIYAKWTAQSFNELTVFLVAVALYLFWQGWLSANTLARTRIYLIDAIEAEPKPDPTRFDIHFSRVDKETKAPGHSR